MDTSGAPWTAVILSGGKGRRLGLGEKSQVMVDGRSLLDHVIAGVPGDVPVVVVGPDVPTSRPVRFILEEPRYGGPVAAVEAGVAVVDTPVIALIATDMPHSGELIALLLPELSDAGASVDAVVPVDDAGRRQPLCAVYRADALRRALAEQGDPAGRSMRDLVARLRVAERPLGREHLALVQDVDTPDDLSRLRQIEG